MLLCPAIRIRGSGEDGEKKADGDEVDKSTAMDSVAFARFEDLAKHAWSGGFCNPKV